MRINSTMLTKYMPMICDNNNTMKFELLGLEIQMKNRDIVIHVDLGLGSGSTTVWTCDLTHGYIEINADYRS